MRRISLFLSTFGLLLAAAAPAVAQDRTGSWEISPFAGGYFGGTFYDSTPYPTPSGFRGVGHIDASTDLAYGARLGYNVNRWFELEFDWTHAKSDLKLHDSFNGVNCPGGSTSPCYSQNTKVGSLTQDVYEANAIFNMGRRKAIGYFEMSAGASVLKPELTGLFANSSTRFTGSFGGGFKYFFTPHAGLRFDGRYRFTETPHTRSTATSCGPYYCYYYRSNWYYSGELTGGLTLAF